MALVLGGCGTGPEIRTRFGFEVEVLPYRTEVAPGETVSLELAIVSDGEWSGERYSLRWFRSDGTGWMADGGSNRITENRLYTLPSRHFSLGYHTVERGSERFAVWVTDSGGEERKLEFEIEAR